MVWGDYASTSFNFTKFWCRLQAQAFDFAARGAA